MLFRHRHTVISYFQHFLTLFYFSEHISPFFYRAGESQFICLISSLHIIAWMGISNAWTLIGLVQAHPAVSVGLRIIMLTFTVTLTRWSRIVIPGWFSMLISVYLCSVWTPTGSHRNRKATLYIHFLAQSETNEVKQMRLSTVSHCNICYLHADWGLTLAAAQIKSL